ncbi:KGG domain-containing protein [Streptomyces sp. NPDC002306]
MAEHKSGRTGKDADPDKQRETRQAPSKRGPETEGKGTAGQFSSEEAREAGHKGGKASQEKRHH